MEKIEQRQIQSEEAKRLAAFEAVYNEVNIGLSDIPKQLEKMKSEGKEKTVRYKELFGQKLMYNYIVSIFEKHGISFEI